MRRVVVYSVIVGILTILINLLKYNNNFKGLSYNSSILEVLSYVTSSFLGLTYVGIHPISKLAKIIITVLCIIKYIILCEFVMYINSDSKNFDIYKGVESIIKSAEVKL
jgi:hypothetical protein